MMDTALGAFRGRDLVDMRILGNVKYYFIPWPNFEYLNPTLFLQSLILLSSYYITL